MITIKSPLRYFSNRYQRAEAIFDVIRYGQRDLHNNKYVCFYDLFSGCGSLALAALELNIAESYVINDPYWAFQCFWETVVYHDQELIADYQRLVTDYKKLNDSEKTAYYEKTQQYFNTHISDLVPCKRAAYFSFILNHAQNNELIFNEQQELICEHMQSIGDALIHDEQFSELITNVKVLFDKHQEHIFFSAKSFQTYCEQITPKDFVVLVPPYPCTPQSIYFRTAGGEELWQQLNRAITDWQQQAIFFLVFYEVVGKNFSTRVFDNVDRFLHLSSSQGAYNDFVENCFIAQSLVHKFAFIDLPHNHLLRWQSSFAHWSELNYEEVVLQLKAKISTYKLPIEHFIEQVHATPEQIAVVWENDGNLQTLLYRELLLASYQLAHYLQEKGNFSVGQRVGVCLSRTADYVVALLAIWHLGLVYVPLCDASPDRLKREGKAKENLIGRLKAFCASTARENLLHAVIINPQLEWLIKSNFDNHTELLFLSLPTLETLEKEALQALLTKERSQEAYVFCSSGTTGTPKIIAVPPEGIYPRLASVIKQLRIESSDGVLNYTGFDFDPSVMEIFMALWTGATLYIVPEAVRLGQQTLSEFYRKIEAEKGKKLPLPAHAILVPSILKTLSPSAFPEWRCLLITGENYDREWLQPWFKEGCQRRIFNGFGPTETTFGATLTEILPGGEITLNHPMQGIELYLAPLSGEMEKTKPWIRWQEEKSTSLITSDNREIYVGGNGIGWYLGPGAEKKNKERFIEYDGKRYFRTSDSVQIQAGNLIFLGRLDRMFKYHGKWVSLDELENLCKSCNTNQSNDPLIKDALTMQYLSEKKGLTNIVFAFLVLHSDTKEEELCKALREKFASVDYRPTMYWCITQLPTTDRGKIDRNLKALQSCKPRWLPIDSKASDNTYIQDDNLEQVENIWQKVLQEYQPEDLEEAIEAVGGSHIERKDLVVHYPLTQKFNELGGDSLLHRQLIEYLWECLAHPFSTFEPLFKSALLEYLELGQMADLLALYQGFSPPVIAHTHSYRIAFYLKSLNEDEYPLEEIPHFTVYSIPILTLEERYWHLDKLTLMQEWMKLFWCFLENIQPEGPYHIIASVESEAKHRELFDILQNKQKMLVPPNIYLTLLLSNDVIYEFFDIPDVFDISYPKINDRFISSIQDPALQKRINDIEKKQIRIRENWLNKYSPSFLSALLYHHQPISLSNENKTTNDVTPHYPLTQNINELDRDFLQHEQLIEYLWKQLAHPCAEFESLFKSALSQYLELGQMEDIMALYQGFQPSLTLVTHTGSSIVFYLKPLNEEKSLLAEITRLTIFHIPLLTLEERQWHLDERTLIKEWLKIFWYFLKEVTVVKVLQPIGPYHIIASVESEAKHQELFDTLRDKENTSAYDDIYLTLLLSNEAFELTYPHILHDRTTLSSEELVFHHRIKILEIKYRLRSLQRKLEHQFQAPVAELGYVPTKWQQHYLEVKDTLTKQLSLSNVIALCASPGGGKTTLLHALYNTFKQQKTCVYLSLRDVPDYQKGLREYLSFQDEDWQFWCEQGRETYWFIDNVEMELGSHKLLALLENLAAFKSPQHCLLAARSWYTPFLMNFIRLAQTQPDITKQTVSLVELNELDIEDGITEILTQLHWPLTPWLYHCCHNLLKNSKETHLNEMRQWVWTQWLAREQQREGVVNAEQYLETVRITATILEEYEQRFSFIPGYFSKSWWSSELQFDELLKKISNTESSLIGILPCHPIQYPGFSTLTPCLQRLEQLLLDNGAWGYRWRDAAWRKLIIAQPYFWPSAAETKIPEQFSLTQEENDCCETLSVGNPDATPWFFLPPITGDIPYLYRSLVSLFKEPPTIYALKMTEKFYTGSISDQAKLFIQVMQKLQPLGRPYQLLGWSYGGLLAYEIGCLLEAEGNDIALIINIDCPPSKSDIEQPLLNERYETVINHLIKQDFIAEQDISQIRDKVQTNLAHMQSYEWEGKNKLKSPYYVFIAAQQEAPVKREDFEGWGLHVEHLTMHYCGESNHFNIFRTTDFKHYFRQLLKNHKDDMSDPRPLIKRLQQKAKEFAASSRPNTNNPLEISYIPLDVISILPENKSPIETQWKYFLENEKSPHCLVLEGLVGAGKSRFIEKLNQELLSLLINFVPEMERKNQELINKPWLPILIHLRETSLQECVTLGLQRFGFSQIDLLCTESMLPVRLLFFFDGCNEINLDLNIYLTQISSRWPTAKAFFVTRQGSLISPSLFEDTQKRFIQWRIQPVDDKHVRDFLDEYEVYMLNVGAQMDFLSLVKTHDWLRTPFLLKAIMELSIIPEKNIKRARLYRLLDKRLFDIWIQALPTVLQTVEHKKELRRSYQHYVHSLAYHLWLESAAIYDETYWKSQENFTAQLHKIAQISVRENTIDFVHFSWREYYLAELVIKYVLNHNFASNSCYLQVPLLLQKITLFDFKRTQLLWEFLLQLSESLPNKKQLRFKQQLFYIIFASRAQQSSMAKHSTANTMTWLTALNVSFAGLDLRGLEILYAYLLGINMDGADARYTNFSGTNFANSRLSNTHLEDSNLSEICFAEFELLDSQNWEGEISLSPDGKQLAGRIENEICALDLCTGNRTFIFSLHEHDGTNIAFSPDSKQVAVVEEGAVGNDEIRLCNLNTKQYIFTPFNSFLGGIAGIAYTLDGEQLILRSPSYMVQLWNINTGNLDTIIFGSYKDINKITNAVNDKEIDYEVIEYGDISCIISGGARVFIIHVQDYGNHLSQKTIFAFNPNGKQLAWVREEKDTIMELWTVGMDMRNRLSIVSGHLNAIANIAYSQNGKQLMSVSCDNTIRLWDANTGNLLSVLSYPYEKIELIAFSPNGQRLAVASKDNSVQGWNTNTRNYDFIDSEHKEQITAITYSGDEKWFACAYKDSTIKLWELQTKFCLSFASDHSALIKEIIFIQNEGQSLFLFSIAYGKFSSFRLWRIQLNNQEYQIQLLLSSEPNKTLTCTNLRLNQNSRLSEINYRLLDQRSHNTMKFSAFDENYSTRLYLSGSIFRDQFSTQTPEAPYALFTLPEEILDRIYSFLFYRDLYCLALTCKFFYTHLHPEDSVTNSLPMPRLHTRPLFTTNDWYDLKPKLLEQLNLMGLLPDEIRGQTKPNNFKITLFNNEDTKHDNYSSIKISDFTDKTVAEWNVWLLITLYYRDHSFFHSNFNNSQPHTFFKPQEENNSICRETSSHVVTNSYEA